jgi:hypothetical protein
MCCVVGQLSGQKFGYYHTNGEIFSEVAFLFLQQYFHDFFLNVLSKQKLDWRPGGKQCCWLSKEAFYRKDNVDYPQS